MYKTLKLINSCKKNSDGRFCYVGEKNGTPVSCSDFAKIVLHESGVITEKEKNDPYSFWAIKGIVGILGDTKRFRWHSTTEKPKDGWIQWYHGHHVSFYYAGGCFESCPSDTHYKATNGRTAVGFFEKNHNCSGGSLTCYYEVIDDEKYDQKIIDDYVNEAIKIAEDNRHGYNNKVGSNLGPDFGQQDMDCGAFVSMVLRHVGLINDKTVFEPNSATGTWGYDDILTEAGFVKNIYNVAKVKKGDILIKSGQHTEICVSAPADGKAGTQVGAHSDKDGKPGDSLGTEISVVALSGYWDYMYRLPVKEDEEYPTLQYGSKGSAVEKLQTLLNKKGADLDVDGSFGPATKAAVIAFQKEHGIYQDAIVGPKTWAALFEEEKKEPETPDAKTMLEEAKRCFDNEYGTDPERKKTLTAKHGAKAAERIQEIINLAAKPL